MRSIPAAPRLRCTASSARPQFSSATTCSISCSYIAFCRRSREVSASGPRPRLAAAPPLLPAALARVFTVVVAPCLLSPLLGVDSSRLSSSVPSSCSPSLQRHYPPSSLLRPLLTSRGLSPTRSPQVRVVLL